LDFVDYGLNIDKGPESPNGNETPAALAERQIREAINNLDTVTSRLARQPKLAIGAKIYVQHTPNDIPSGNRVITSINLAGDLVTSDGNVDAATGHLIEVAVPVPELSAPTAPPRPVPPTQNSGE
jgi:hypothetical protein